MSDFNSLTALTCNTCRRMWHIDTDEYNWLETSGEAFWCPYCGGSISFSTGSLARVRKQYVHHQSTLRTLMTLKDKYWEMGVQKDGTIRALRSHVTRLKRLLAEAKKGTRSK